MTAWAVLVEVYRALRSLLKQVGDLEFTNRTCPVCGARFSDMAQDGDEKTSVRAIAESLD